MRGPNDRNGIYIDDVFLAEYIEINSNYNKWKDLLEYCFSNKFIQLIDKFPGSRLFFKYVMNFYINLDRLQFYYYHNQNFTQYSDFLLSKNYLFLQEKGTLFQIITC